MIRATRMFNKKRDEYSSVGLMTGGGSLSTVQVVCIFQAKFVISNRYEDNDMPENSLYRELVLVRNFDTHVSKCPTTNFTRLSWACAQQEFAVHDLTSIVSLRYIVPPLLETDAHFRLNPFITHLD